MEPETEETTIEEDFSDTYTFVPEDWAKDAKKRHLERTVARMRRDIDYIWVDSAPIEGEEANW